MKYRGYTLSICLLAQVSCGGSSASVRSAKPAPLESGAPSSNRPHQAQDTRAPAPSVAVPFWTAGASKAPVDASKADEEGTLVLDLGDDWTPYIFTEHDGVAAEAVPNSYRQTYLQLARGEYPNDQHGRRAKEDKYLELYGILPTLTLLRQRFETVEKLPCAQKLDLAPLEAFSGFIVYKGNNEAKKRARRAAALDREFRQLLQRKGAKSAQELSQETLSKRDQRTVAQHERFVPRWKAVKAAQARLRCEGYLKGKHRPVEGGLDWITHEALAEFERRHRVYAWGYIGKETLKRLRQAPLSLEHEAVVRVLTERAVHAAGVLEDGSVTGKAGRPVTYKGKDGARHSVPDLEAELRKRVVEAFGLHDPESTLAWLKNLGDLTGEERHWVAIPRPALPEYYSPDMELQVVINRGDVWYDFPYDSGGKERSQPVRYRPALTVLVKYQGQNIPLVRYGTTIGGWRSEMVGDTVMWKYKGSPTGPRLWTQIVAAPVWVPPESTPPQDLMSRVPGKRGKERYEVNMHEVGPSYASAYGLVAAYHRLYRRLPDGKLLIRGDQGIRTHGSVDYMSIRRRHSHGCHRLHNHLAVRLMSFMLEHRPHTRVGQDRIRYERVLPFEDFEYTMTITEGGYIYQLLEPIRVTVLEGRIRGAQKSPIPFGIPKYNDEAGAFLMPDGRAVALRKGRLVEVPYEPKDDAAPSSQRAPRAPAPLAPQPGDEAWSPATW